MSNPYKSSQKFENRAFLFFLLLTTLAFIGVLKPFFGALFWSCAVAIIFYPLQKRLKTWMGDKPNTTAFCTLMISVVIVILPVVILLSSAASEGQDLYQKIKNNNLNLTDIVAQLRGKYPGVESFLANLGFDWQEVNSRINDLALIVGKFVAENMFSAGKQTASFLLSLTLMLYVAFFLLRDGDKLVPLLILALPLGDTRERLLFQKFAEVTRATVKGNLVVAMVQGALGGMIFWFLGLDAPVLWGFVMAFASLVPAVGAAIIWAPAALYLFATGQYTDATILTVFGAGVIGVADNVLRPLLVGRDTKMPDYLVLISTLGGIALVGINGFVIGPLIAALFIAAWGIFIREFQEEVEEAQEEVEEAPQD